MALRGPLRGAVHKTAHGDDPFDCCTTFLGWALLFHAWTHFTGVVIRVWHGLEICRCLLNQKKKRIFFAHIDRIAGASLCDQIFVLIAVRHGTIRSTEVSNWRACAIIAMLLGHHGACTGCVFKTPSRLSERVGSHGQLD